jgi:muramidase (phage lysozyme)
LDSSPQAVATALDGISQLRQLATLMVNPIVGYASLPASVAARGVDGVSLSDHYLSAFDQHWNDISAMMGQASRKLFDGPATAMRHELANRLQQHEAEQRQVLQSLARDNSKARAADSAATEATDTTDTADGAFSPEAFGRKVVEPVVSHQLSESRVSDARAFLDRYRYGMTPDAADALEAKVVAAEGYGRGSLNGGVQGTAAPRAATSGSADPSGEYQPGGPDRYEVAGLDGAGIKSPEAFREQKLLRELAANTKDKSIQFDDKLGRLVHSQINLDGSVSRALLDGQETQAFKERELGAITYIPSVESPEEKKREDAISPDEDYDLSVLRLPESERPAARVANVRAVLRDPRVLAYLDTIAYAEGYRSGKPVEYDTLFGDNPNAKVRHRLENYGGRPVASGVKFNGGSPTASGRYQIVGPTYDEFSKKLGLKGLAPDSQDMMAAQMLIEGGIVKALWHGDFADAVNRSRRWASMPEFVGGVWKARKSDQPSAPFEKLQQYYEDRLKEHSMRQWLEDTGIIQTPDAQPPLWQPAQPLKK